MLRLTQYTFDHSSAVAAGAIYPAEPLYKTGWTSIVNNGVEPPHIAATDFRHGALGTYFMLLVTAESPAFVRLKML